MNNYNLASRSNNAIKKKKRRRRLLLGFLILLFLSAITFFGYILVKTYQVSSSAFNDIDGRDGKSELRDEPVYISTDPFSVLLLGIEDYSDDYDQGRSDSILVATFNPEFQTMKLLSIPRDTLVDIPGYDQDKINHSYADGGKELVIETVEDFLDIPIDYYATVNFDGFKNIIDIVGGVTVDVPFTFDDINSKWDRFYFEEGKQKLNGEEALVYARMRKKDPRGDFGRNMRQRQIITGLIDKLSSPSTLLKIDDIADEVGTNIQTNMRMKEALAFRKKYPDFNSSSIEQLELTGEDYNNSYGTYYFIPSEESLNEVKQTLASHLELGLSSSNETAESTTIETSGQ
ncbi:LytR family transcriptional regulator [Bacillus sp. FJAT-27225]|uniref:LCP family protein n=1 Tax=Bacillus sp. FJAT-27225 TaxID=1743144 RepID=UPI00080C2BD9|nr:LCP family protein [Bacillus sp. FJAT-27225]OCA88266.1 LytR family transcriptional regulator [Bacillus sp. FJAT-27225]